MALLDNVYRLVNKRSPVANTVKRFIDESRHIAIENASTGNENASDIIFGNAEYSDEDLTRLRQSNALKELYESGGDETVAWIQKQLADVCDDASGVTSADDEDECDEEDCKDDKGDEIIEDAMSDIETPELELDTE